MSKHFWLIQRGSFNKRLKNLKDATDFLGGSSTHLINPDYMGSSEFEWGAIPKAYRRLHYHYDEYELFITDLVTTGGVPFCLYCKRSKYEQILDELKRYIEDPYKLKEWTNMDAHFHELNSENKFLIDHRKYQLKTNFWWCIDKDLTDEDIGDWIAFVGTADRQNAFLRVINEDHNSWYMKTY